MNFNKTTGLLTNSQVLASAILVVGVMLLGAGAMFLGNPHSVQASPTAIQPETEGAALGYFHPLAPSRILDTRTQSIGCSPSTCGPRKMWNGETISVRVTGVGGVPATGVSSVVLNVTVTQPTSAGYLTVFPSGVARPNASNLNFVAGQTVPNLVMVKVGGNGKVDVYNPDGATHVILDVVGYYDDILGGSSTGGQQFRSLPPARILDTRTTVGGHPGKLGANTTMSTKLTGVGGVPASGVSAVLVNATVTGPTAPSFLTIYPGDGARPNASNLNFTAGQTVPNLVAVKLGADGKVNVFNSAGQTHVVLDVVGYFGPITNTAGGQAGAVTPSRILDTRTSTGGHPAKLGAGATTSVQVAGLGGVPTTGSAAVIMNVTVTHPTAPSFLTVFPSDMVRPNASNLNFAAGQTVPNLVTVSLGTDGRVNVFNASGFTHVIFDVVGFYTADSFVTSPPNEGEVPSPPTDAAPTFNAQTADDYVVSTGGKKTPEEIAEFWARQEAGEFRTESMPDTKSDPDNPMAYVGRNTQPSYSISSQGYVGLNSYPAAVGRLTYYIPPHNGEGGYRSNCSGTVVARNLVLTAAHCVTNGLVEFEAFRFAPAQQGSSKPYGTWYTDVARYHSFYVTAKSLDASEWFPGLTGEQACQQQGFCFWPADYALLVFEPQNGGRYIGDQTGYFPILSNAPAGQGYSMGYPSEGSYFSRYCTHGSANVDSCYQWYCYSPISAYVKHYTGWYEQGQGCNISGGHSGGPIFQQVNGTWYVTSVNSNAPNLQSDSQGRTFSKNIWGPYFNSWVISLYNANVVR